jgi:HEAT repeat protein
MLHEDDEQNRWNAMQLIARHTDASFDKQLSQLLEDPDPLARGMAGYVAVKRWNKRALPILEKRLDDPVALIRFDAISAMAMDGGSAGREIVERYLQSGREPDQRLREIIPKILEEQKAKLTTSAREPH